LLKKLFAEKARLSRARRIENKVQSICCQPWCPSNP